MEKQLTAMQELIEKLEQKRALFTRETASHKETRRTYSVAILTAKNMLSKEKQQIIYAYDKGCTTKTDLNNGQQYFTNTFKTE